MTTGALALVQKGRLDMATVFKRNGKGNWIISWYDAEGKRRCKSSKTTDHATAERIAAKLEAEVALRREGVVDSRLDRIAKQAGLPISSHLDDFGAHQRTRAGVDHIEKTRRFIEKICEFNNWRLLRDLDADGANRYAEHKFGEGRSPRTVQSHLTALTSFSRWAVRTGRLIADPLATVSKPNPESDRRVIRRFLTHEEFDWLSTITQRSIEAFGMDGPQRALLYRTAIETGLRAGELRSLTRGKLHLSGDTPFILAKASTTKNKKIARQYVTKELAHELSVFVSRKVSGVAVFGMPSAFDTAEMLRADLAKARAEWLATIPDPQQRIELARRLSAGVRF